MLTQPQINFIFMRNAMNAFLNISYFIFSYKAGYYNTPEVHHVYLSPPEKYVEFVEKPIYIERIVPKPIYKPHAEYAAPIWSQPDPPYG